MTSCLELQKEKIVRPVIYLFIYRYNDIHAYMAILVEVNMKDEITKTTMEGYG